MTKNHLLITAPTDRLVCCKEKRREEAQAIKYINTSLVSRYRSLCNKYSMWMTNVHTNLTHNFDCQCNHAIHTCILLMQLH